MKRKTSVRSPGTFCLLLMIIRATRLSVAQGEDKGNKHQKEKTSNMIYTADRAGAASHQKFLNNS
ncbi:MAG TPA: hypothetical protein VF899_22765 [Pyrinomonadaceae bacterium]